MLGVRPILGRTFMIEEEAAGADAVIVLSHAIKGARSWPWIDTRLAIVAPTS
jgi:hypothetical protein